MIKDNLLQHSRIPYQDQLNMRDVPFEYALRTYCQYINPHLFEIISAWGGVCGYRTPYGERENFSLEVFTQYDYSLKVKYADQLEIFDGDICVGLIHHDTVSPYGVGAFASFTYPLRVHNSPISEKIVRAMLE